VNPYPPDSASVLLSPAFLDVADREVRGSLEAQVRALAGQRGRSVAAVSFGPAVTDALLTLDLSGDRFPVTARAAHQAFAYVQGRIADVRALDAGDVLDALGARTGSSAALGEFLTLLCRAALLADRALPPGPAPAESGDITLRIHPAYLRELSLQPDVEGLFPFLRDGLFEELGLRLPSFRFRRTLDLRPRSFSFEVAGMESLPQAGLASDSILVNDSAERLARHGVRGEPAENPATGQVASVVPARHKEQLDEAGFTTWNSFGFLILCAATTVRAQAATLVTVAEVERMLSALSLAIPHLAGIAQSRLATGDLAVVLQALLREGVSIRNLRRIVELLLRFETLDGEDEGTDRLQYVRSGLGDQITAAVTSGGTTLVAYLLDPELETAPPGDRLAAAVEQQVAQLSPGVRMPAILTQPQYRLQVRNAICRRLPHAPVISYSELPPSLTIQPVARISL
jgi:type III secretory pathway component EscV